MGYLDEVDRAIFSLPCLIAEDMVWIVLRVEVHKIRESEDTLGGRGRCASRGQMQLCSSKRLGLFDGPHDMLIDDDRKRVFGIQSVGGALGKAATFNRCVLCWQ